MRIFFGFVILFTLLAGCNTDSSRPNELIDEETYERMFIEFTIINQLDQRLKQDKTEEELREMVYNHYGVSREEFRISHQYYEQNIDEQLERVRSMTRQMRAERDTLIVLEREYKEAIRDNKLDSLRQVLFDNE